MNIEKNRVVSIHYKLTSSNGELIESNEGEEPLEYLHGKGDIFPALEAVLEGKQKGDSFTASLPPAEAYGEYDEALIADFEKGRFEDPERIAVGMEFAGQSLDGQYRVFRIVGIDGDSVKVNGNHPLAGKTLNFAGIVADVRDATEEEIAHGHAHGEEGCRGCHGGCGEEEGGCGDGCCGCH